MRTIWTFGVLAILVFGSCSSGSAGGATGAAGTSGVAGTSGMAGTSGSAGTSGAAGTGVAPPPAMGSLTARLVTSEVTVAAGVKPGVRNWRVWNAAMLKVSPVFTAPLAACGTLVGYTSGTAAAPNARVVRLDADDELVDVLDLGAGLEMRGLAAEPDGHFAALLWDATAKRIWTKRFDAAGTAGWSTELTNTENHPTDFGIGEARLEFGDGKYGAYYHVHSDSGHEGDTLKFTDAATGAETTQWDWGCSHSMSDLLTYNPANKSFLPSCVTDCYPGTTGDFVTMSKGGFYTDNKNKVLDIDGGCNGSVGGELGGAAAASAGWKVVLNAHQTPLALGEMSYDKAMANQDIGFASIGADHKATGAVVWLTTTPLNEADSTIARWQPEGDSVEQYVVGWMTPTAPVAYNLARVGADGAVLEGPVDVSVKARWGQRDDPFRVHANRDVVWAWFDAAGGTTLHLARLSSGATATCTMP
jgi:hypothetical protein